jgi:hypothetical protein
MNEPWGGTTRWEFLKEGFRELERPLTGFVAFSGGLRSGDRDVCDPSLYGPEVPVTSTTTSEDLVGALELAPPGGSNPFLLAFRELVPYVASGPAGGGAWPVILLVTATQPDDCPSTTGVNDLALAIAGVFNGLPRVDIVTVALGADYDVDILAKVAGKLPFRIGADEPPSRLAEVFGRCGFPVLECPSLALPSSGQNVDFESVWVGTSTSRGVESPPRVSGPEACASSSNGGYYIDTSSDSAEVRLCPCSCPRFGYCDVELQFKCK